MAYEQVAVLIPAYKPDNQLIEMVDGLRRVGFQHIVVVDDGSGGAYGSVFDQIDEKTELLRHPVNRGKGSALKTGIAHLQGSGFHIVTADADGQHAPEDCGKIADALIRHPNALILGVRNKKDMPMRSKAGNRITCFSLGLMTGLWITDTQTGLRGLPDSALTRLGTLAGERYEYELNMLIDARKMRLPVIEVPIQTIYLDDNASSHFNTLRDSARIYRLLFRHFAAYAGSSLFSGFVDYALFFTLRSFLPGADYLPLTVYSARAVSVLVNYLINRNLVFKQNKRPITLLAYYALAACIASLSWLGIRTVSHWGIPELWAKPLVDTTLFFLNYAVQKNVIFKEPREKVA